MIGKEKIMCNFKDTLKSVIQQHKGKFTELQEGEIPPIIHRIWLGKEMPEASFLTLQHFQEHMQQSGSQYTHCLWVHAVEDDGLKAQISELAECGMVIRDMSDVWEARQGIKGELEKWISEGAQDPSKYKFASDIFRMYILFIEGGIYMDVDIDVREELFAEPIFHRFQFADGSYMPLLGSIVPFEDLFQTANRNVADYMELEYRMYRSKGGYGWNYFFASVPGNPVIERMMREACNGDAQSMTVNMVETFFGQILGTKEEKGSALFDYAFAPLDLQYCTRASVEKDI